MSSKSFLNNHDELRTLAEQRYIEDAAELASTSACDREKTPKENNRGNKGLRLT